MTNMFGSIYVLQFFATRHSLCHAVATMQLRRQKENNLTYTTFKLETPSYKLPAMYIVPGLSSALVPIAKSVPKSALAEPKSEICSSGRMQQTKVVNKKIKYDYKEVILDIDYLHRCRNSFSTVWLQSNNACIQSANNLWVLQ